MMTMTIRRRCRTRRPMTWCRPAQAVGGAGGGIPLGGFAPPGLPALGGVIHLWPPRL